jgi:integrase
LAGKQGSVSRGYQRPSVHKKVQKGGAAVWFGEWRSKVAGRDRPLHRTQSWPCKDFTKSEAQDELDKLVREETRGVLRPDGKLTVQQFFDEVYWPTKKLRIQPNTQYSYKGAWNQHVSTLGPLKLEQVNKAAIDAMFNKMALDGLRESTLGCSLSLVKDLMEEALEGGYIQRNPSNKVVLPHAKAAVPTPTMTSQQVHNLLEGLSEERDYIFWRTLTLSGCRVSEVLALAKTDVLPGALNITKSAFNGKAATTKNKKSRTIPIAAELEDELREWSKTVEGDLLFPNRVGNMMQRSGHVIRGILKRAREASGVADLTFRMCRTTLATLWKGDYKDLQDTLGHASVDMTLGAYRKKQIERQKQEVERLNAEFSGKVVPMPSKKAAS